MQVSEGMRLEGRNNLANLMDFGYLIFPDMSSLIGCDKNNIGKSSRADDCFSSDLLSKEVESPRRLAGSNT